MQWARSDSNTLTPKGTDLQSAVTLQRYRSPLLMAKDPPHLPIIASLPSSAATVGKVPSPSVTCL
ncbi:hypothetical protein N374_gp068 [Bacillus phage phiNIT1]|uniref:Uncharacterized protein n=1 Tax=Bacillus phage phiNIT1 TaxID=207656 RepID=S6BUT0_9CAUD|nr:hypothetical protein N374_gp068 [Bacillus phage phiNIT1]BAN59555.1 hypothetical protein [Bacillus phage phiNIT1]